MKTSIFTTSFLLYCILLLLVFTSGKQVFAASEITDTILEIGPQKTIIVVADQTINQIEAIYIEEQPGNHILVDKDVLESGSLVTATLDSKDEDGYWYASKIVVHTGSAREQKLNQLSMNQMMTAENATKEPEETLAKEEQVEQENDGETTLQLVNGVWVNN